MTFVYAWIVPLWATQLLPQLLMEQFDTLRYNVDTLNICMKEFIIFVCTDSAEIFFSKLRSAGLNYNLPSFFTESYCAVADLGGVLWVLQHPQLSKKNLNLPFSFSIDHMYLFASSVNRFKSQHPRD